MHHDPLPDDLLDVAQTLERQRPRLDPLELDGLKRRTLRASRTTSTRKGPFMRTRLAIMTLLCSGLLLSSGATAVGVTALRQTDDAGVAQYGSPSDDGQALDESVPGGDDTTADDAGPVAGDSAAGGDDAEVLGATTGDDDAAQATRQISTVSGDSLPFTGYAAIPVLLLGLALLAAGLTLRRRPAQI